MNAGTEYRRALVSNQFHRARRRAALEALLARVSGRPADLLSFTEVIDKLGVSGQSSLGVQQIPIDAIIGSVGRYQDFSRTVLPRLEEDEDRWVGVGVAADSIAQLPPIEVYKVGEAYFVLDGNHRVSIARQQKLRFLDAAVVEVRTRAPLPPGANPERLIIAAEYAAFLEFTQLDLVRPGADLQVSVPGQYRHLEGHIEAYRFILETGEACEIPFNEAAGRWYDDVYLPLVQAIREQGILRYFPGRSETDFFIWLARHRADLQNELGTTISPAVAVSRLAERVREAAEVAPPLTTRLRRLTRLTAPEQTGRLPHRTWAQERTLDRYSNHLFSNMLFPVRIDEATGRHAAAGVARLLALGRAEGANLCLLCLIDHPPTPGESAAIDALRQTIADQSVPCELLIRIGDPDHWTKEVGLLHDLIVVDTALAGPAAAAGPAATAGNALPVILRGLARPLLVLGDAPVELPRRALLVHDTRRALDEAVFIAAYLAERWGVGLTVLPLGNGRNTHEIADHISDYLALHEVAADFLDPIRPDARAVERIIATGLGGGYDLLIMTGPARGHKTNHNQQLTDMNGAILQRWPHAALIAT